MLTRKLFSLLPVSHEFLVDCFMFLYHSPELSHLFFLLQSSEHIWLLSFKSYLILQDFNFFTKLVNLSLLNSKFVLKVTNLVDFWQRRKSAFQEHNRLFKLITLPLSFCEASLNVLFMERAHNSWIKLISVLHLKTLFCVGKSHLFVSF